MNLSINRLLYTKLQVIKNILGVQGSNNLIFSLILRFYFLYLVLLYILKKLPQYFFVYVCVYGLNRVYINQSIFMKNYNYNIQIHVSLSFKDSPQVISSIKMLIVEKLLLM